MATDLRQCKAGDTLHTKSGEKVTYLRKNDTHFMRDVYPHLVKTSTGSLRCYTNAGTYLAKGSHANDILNKE